MGFLFFNPDTLSEGYTMKHPDTGHAGHLCKCDDEYDRPVACPVHPEEHRPFPEWPFYFVTFLLFVGLALVMMAL